MTEDLLLELSSSVVDGDVARAKEAVTRLIERKEEPLTIVNGGISAGLKIVGERFECQEYFIPDLLASAYVTKEAMALLRPYMLTKKAGLKAARVVIGTVQGDVHDIGKNLVATMLEGAGFEVVDLGVDTPAQRFVDSVKNGDVSLLGLSALLTSTMPRMKDVIEALKREGVREKTKVIVGGAPVNEEFARKIGADAYARDALEAIRKAEELTRGSL